MPFLPLKEKPFRNVDSESNQMAIEYFVDMVKDDFMSNTNRHGLGGANDYFVDSGTNSPVDSVFEIRNANISAAFSDGKLFKITNTGVATEITGATLNLSTPVSYADDGDVGYFCNNSAILKWTYSSGTCALLADPQAPTDATHLGFLNSRLYALRADSQQLEWSDLDAPDDWAGSYAEAGSRPDNAVALHSHFNELFIPGAATTEFWTSTGIAVSPIQRLTGASQERGCIAPYSVTQIDNTYLYLDNERRVIRMNGRMPQVISNPYDSEFQNLTVASDAIGYGYNSEGSTLYVLTFPSDKKTYYYDYKLDCWGEFSYWNTGTYERNHYLGRCGVYVDAWSTYLIGSRLDGKIYIPSSDYTTDGGGTIISEMWTGRIDWGTHHTKTSKKMKVRLKRGRGAGELFMYHRDNGSGTWSNPYEVNLGILGDMESTVTLRRLGQYVDRQWRFTSTGDVTIVSAEEIFEVLDD